jgi:hypothetical protein
VQIDVGRLSSDSIDRGEVASVGSANFREDSARVHGSIVDGQGIDRSGPESAVERVGIPGGCHSGDGIHGCQAVAIPATDVSEVSADVHDAAIQRQGVDGHRILRTRVRVPGRNALV